ncbi:ShlB/FhaC/HecB family hemolysin secretion/activation protein [Spirulina sp. CCNP1310]|uniref:ShlB/FhaC/HecB family hemolysin secretion/activation protein n=1 Tax=Spirulina sp. CCNP1310 TaxID=3110249 RepID=UPI002B209F85|nr:ShlB/FhaC/HecB family hemolysin secretion/activation protein [Spirulina sp. CCNP1310]MEA5420684.1 ShlB/FhaC/HecB family hemolysin secretion/activation protein [Spirulina sp. CCNP1310]
MDQSRYYLASNLAWLLFSLPLPVASQPLPPQTPEPPSPIPPNTIPLPAPPALEKPSEPLDSPRAQCVVNTATNPQTLLGPIPTDQTVMTGSEHRQTLPPLQFVGNRVFSNQELQAVLGADLVGAEEYSFLDLLPLAQKITTHYNEAGYINSYATIPPQVVDERAGLVILVIEGGLGTIHLYSPQGGRLGKRYLCDRLIGAARPLRLSHLLDALRQLQLDPLIGEIQAELVPTARPEQHDLHLTIREAPSFTARFGLDNARPTSIGTYRRQIQLTEGNLLGWGDRLTFLFSQTDGSTNFDGSYSLPLNPQNGRLTFSLGEGKSKVIEPPFDALDLRGESRSWDLTWQQPIPLGRVTTSPNLTPATQRELALSLSLNHRQSQTSILGFDFPLSPGADAQGRLAVSRLSFGQEWTQRGDRDYLQLRSHFSLGLNAFNATINPTGPDSRFFHWQGQGVWLHRFPHQGQLLVNGRLQWSDRPLLGAEQITLGGLGAVRGYRQDLLSQDQGAFFSVEYQHPLIGKFNHPGGIVRIAPFFDWGRVWPASSATGQTGATLASVGLGLLWTIPQGFDLGLYWGLPLTFQDQGSSQRYRNATFQENGFHLFLQSTLEF